MPRSSLSLAAGLAAVLCVAAAAQEVPRARGTSWADLAPVHQLLEARGLAPAEFPGYLQRTRQANSARVRDGDLDHLVFYLLQSTRFTGAAPIEPALSAKAFVPSLDVVKPGEGPPQTAAALPHVPEAVRWRAGALASALSEPAGDPRLVYFRQLLDAAEPDRSRWTDLLLREYVRVMRFVYDTEFVAQRSGGRDAVTELYRRRGLSTDTSVEAGYLVYLGLGMLRGLDPERRIRRVLIVGPGLDLAPRTALADERPPASYQPWAVIDALLALGLASLDDLHVVAADINPRVVDHLRRATAEPPVLTMMSEVGGAAGVTLSEDYRAYFDRLGRAVGEPVAGAPDRFSRTIHVHRGAAAALQAVPLDIVTERLEASPFDLVIATNIFPYFDDVQLMLAMSNVAAMLAPGGVFLHNEPRALLGEITEAFGVRFEGSRHAIIATVHGAPAPLGDSIFLHRRVHPEPSPHRTSSPPAPRAAGRRASGGPCG